MNALDLAKVGKAFGFSVPPRVNVNIGTGKSTTSKSERKRPREDVEDSEAGKEEEEETEARRTDRKSKERRIETDGRKKVGKEIYRKKDRQGAGTGQWSR